MSVAPIAAAMKIQDEAPLEFIPQQQASSAIDKNKYKTRLCRNWTNGQECPYGDRCVFAHGEHEKKREGAMPAGVVDLSTQPATIVPQTLVIRRQQPSVLRQVPQVATRSPLGMGQVESATPPYAFMSEQSSSPVYFNEFSQQQQSFEQSIGYENHSFTSESAETSGLHTPHQTPLSQSLACTPARSPQPAGGQSPASVCLEPAHPRSCGDDRSLCSSPTTTMSHYRYEPYGTGVVCRLGCGIPSSNSSNAISDCDSPSESPRQEPVEFQI
eukprot:gene19548-30115_t